MIADVDDARLPDHSSTGLQQFPTRLFKDFAGPLDQIVYSVINLLLALAAARGSSAEDFGKFAIVVLAATSGVFIARSFTGMLIAVQRRDVSGDGASRTLSQGVMTVGLCAAIAVGLGLIAIPIVGVHARVLTWPLVVLLAVTPVAMLEDYLRFVLFNRLRADLALRMDLVWFVVFVGVLAIGFVLGTDDSLVYLAGAWAIGCLVATVVGVRSVGSRWLRPARQFTRGVWRPGLTLAIDAAFAALRVQGTFWLVFALSSAQNASGLRLTLSLFGFVTTVALGLRASELPVLVAHFDEGGLVAYRRLLARMTLVVWAVAVLSTLALVLLPASLGRALFGDVWQYAEPLIVPVGLAQMVVGIEVAFSSSLLAAQMLRLHLFAKIATALSALAAYRFALGTLEWSVGTAAIAAAVTTLSIWLLISSRAQLRVWRGGEATG